MSLFWAKIILHSNINHETSRILLRKIKIISLKWFINKFYGSAGQIVKILKYFNEN